MPYREKVEDGLRKTTWWNSNDEILPINNNSGIFVHTILIERENGAISPWIQKSQQKFSLLKRPFKRWATNINKTRWRGRRVEPPLYDNQICPIIQHIKLQFQALLVVKAVYNANLRLMSCKKAFHISLVRLNDFLKKNPIIAINVIKTNYILTLLKCWY